ncbi:MAG: NAD(P)/FAD-dependent oxidoreductase [Lachnospiraceae bacterium]|nr:NAD(P)/FAD-dependent oxidoreductase [Lachnospiraceae bacterium]
MKVIVVGGGAAGLAAAISAAGEGAQVLLLEKNEKLGRKIYITGKGRCNLTNACDDDEFFRHIMRNPRFMYSSYRSFSCRDMMELLESAGLRLKVERGSRVFPASDHASDVTRTLGRIAAGRGVGIRLNTAVRNLIIEDGICRGVKTAEGDMSADRVIVATGGLSYPSTGSTGDGYKWARAAGHDVRELFPSLVPLAAAVDGGWDIASMAGLSPRNVTLTLIRGKKRTRSEIGEMLFTHEGISGPLVLTLSSMISGEDLSGMRLELDWKPALSEDELDARLLREFDAAPKKSLKNVMRSLLPESAVMPVLSQSETDPDAPAAEVTKAARLSLLHALKSFRLKIKGLGPMEGAVITRGGIDTRQIDPATMESKLIKGLFFAGEVLDVDATTGGFNLQIAWTTGWAAGAAAGRILQGQDKQTFYTE